MSDNQLKNTNITQYGEKSIVAVVNDGGTLQTQTIQTFADISTALEIHISNIGGFHIDRNETQQFLSWIDTPLTQDNSLNDKRIAILLGKAGCGKSVILKDVLLNLQKRDDCKVLAFKSDIFYDGKDSQDINLKANLGKPIIKAIEEASQRYKTILIIDQIDALSAVLSSQRKPLAEMIGLINQAAQIPNVRILISCRPYDFYYDQSFSDLRHCKLITVYQLTEEEIRKTLYENGLPSDIHISPDLLLLLSNPLNLSLFCKVHSDKSAYNIKNVTDLYSLLWENMLDNYQGNTIELIDFLWYFVSLLYKKQTLSIHKSLLSSTWHKECQYLLSKGIIVENKDVWQFMHQTLFDYVFARLFFEKQQKLEDLLETKHQGLFVRNHIKQILEYQHTTDSKGFLHNVQMILFDTTDNESCYKYRFHIRHLTISIIANFDNYTKLEERLIYQRIFTNKQYLFHFINSITTYAGFILYKNWINMQGGFFAIENNLQDYIFTILSKTLYRNFKEQIQYIRTICDSKLSTLHKNRLISLLERQGQIEFTEDLQYVINFLDVNNDILVFPHMMETNIFHNTDWVIERLKKYLFLLYRKTSEDTFNYHNNVPYEAKHIYDKLKQHFPSKAYQFAYDLVAYIAENTILDLEDDIKSSMAYWNYNQQTSLESNFHVCLVNDMRSYLCYLLNKNQKEEVENKMSILIQTKLVIMHAIVASVLRHGILQDKQRAINYLIKNINRTYHSSVLTYYYIQLFESVVQSGISTQELSELFDCIKKISPDWEKKHFSYPNRKYPLSNIGYTRAQYYHCVPEQMLKNFPEEYSFYISMKRKYPDLKNTAPNKMEVHEGYTSLPKNVFEKMEKEADILNAMRSYNDDDLIDFEKPTLTGVANSFAQQALKKPDKFYAIYLKALHDSSIHIKYIIEGLESLIRCNYSPDKIDQLFCLLIKEIQHRDNVEQPLTNLIMCSRIEYYIKQQLHMPQEVYNFVRNIVLNPSKDEDEIDNIDYNLPLNRERGRAIDSLMHTCWDKNYADDILNVLEQIVPVASITSKVGILFRMACLLNVNYQKTLQLFLEITKDGNPNYFKLPIHSANPILYFIDKDFEQLLPYFNKAMQSTVGNDVTADFLFRAWLNGQESAKTMLFNFADKSPIARTKIIDFVGKYFHATFAQQMQETLLRYLQYEEKELAEEYDEIFKYLSNWEQNFDCQQFLSTFIHSRLCVFCSYRIYEYMKYLATVNPHYCLELLSILYEKKSTSQKYTIEYNELQSITEILIEAYNNVRVYDNTDYSLESAMDLLDKLLEKEDINYYLNKCLNDLDK